MNDLLESLNSEVVGVRGEEPPSRFGEISFGIFGLVFIAFCIWLTVRIVNRRERWAKWTAVMIALPILYVASFGPATRLLPFETFKDVYRPCIWLAVDTPDAIRNTMSRWVELSGNIGVLNYLYYERHAPEPAGLHLLPLPEQGD